LDFRILPPSKSRDDSAAGQLRDAAAPGVPIPYGCEHSGLSARPHDPLPTSDRSHATISDGAATVNRDKISAHLAEVLVSPLFANAPALGRLLRYLVECTLDGKGAELREYIIGVDVFQRGTDFDPKADSIVRVQARKLRQKLDAYYAEKPVSAGIRISMQPGSYVPSFKTAPIPAIPDGCTVAVMPFTSLGTGPGDAAYLADSFTDELIHAISRIQDTRVVARTSSFAARDSGQNARDVGRRLGVRSILTGSLRWSVGNVTVLAQLVDVESGLQEWSERREVPEQSLFTLPGDIARAIACVLHHEPVPVVQSVEDPAAFQLFLRGRHYWNQRTDQGFGRAVDFYRQALDIDPGMSRAWAALSETYFLLAMHGLEAPAEALPKSKAAAERGLLFDPYSAACHAAHATALYFFDQDATAAEAAWRTALSRDPNYANAWHVFAFFLSSRRRSDEAVNAIRAAERIDPLSAPVANDIGFILYWSGDTEGARLQCQRAINAYPWFYRTYLLLARCLAAEGDFTAALETARAAVPLLKGRAFYTYHLATLGYCHARLGQSTAVQAILAELDAIGRRHYYSKIDRALVHHALGDRSLAAYWIEQAVRERNPWELLREADPLWRGH
jgi:serine/threonine-protein kinase